MIMRQPLIALMALSFLGLMSRYRWRFSAVPFHHVGFFALGQSECTADET